jgi:hypothetical protein
MHKITLLKKQLGHPYLIIVEFVANFCCLLKFDHDIQIIGNKSLYCYFVTEFFFGVHQTCISKVSVDFINQFIWSVKSFLCNFEVIR